jgi:hypothetical protein
MRYREAKGLIDGSAPPEDPRLWVIRGRAFGALKREKETSACYAKALKLGPHDVQVRLAALPPEGDPDVEARVLADVWRELELHPDQPVEGLRELSARYDSLAQAFSSRCNYQEEIDAYS